MKDYYQILGVDRRANAAEIKRAFRKMAITYHPDRNPSKDAEAIIKEVIEAYEILDDPDKKLLYDSLLVDRVALEEAERFRQRQRQQSPFGRPAPKFYHKSEREEMLDFMHRNIRYPVSFSWISLAFCAFLAFDFFLPVAEQQETIRGVHKQLYAVGESEKFETDKGREFKISLENAGKFREGQAIVIAYSRILKVPRSFQSVTTREVTRIPATIYGNFCFAPILLGVAALVGVSYRKGLVFRFNIGIVNLLLSLLTILFLFIHHLRLS